MTKIWKLCFWACYAGPRLIYTKCRRSLVDYKKLRVAKAFARDIFALGGPDLRHLPGDELIAILEAGAEVIAKASILAGVSTKEAATAFQQLGSANKWPQM